MPDTEKITADLDDFYSSESIAQWQQIIGSNLHYHFGYFFGNEDLETGLKQTVRNFYPHIDEGAKMLDVGCGWGGPARQLVAEKNCTITGITISSAQTDYCKKIGLDVRQQDLDDPSAMPDTGYDLIFSLEMISHIADKLDFLKRMRKAGRKMILSESCTIDGYSQSHLSFGDSLILPEVSELKEQVEAAGWTIVELRNRRFQSLRTIPLWRENLNRVFGDKEPTGQFRALKGLTDAALPNMIEWNRCFPLIDIIAVRDDPRS